MLTVKAYRDTPGLCGPTSLRIVLERYGVKKSELALARLAKANTKDGVSERGMRRAIRRLGFKAVSRQGASFRDIRRYIKQKIPVIVGWFSVSDSHYSVVIGIDKKYIWIADPEFGKKRRFKIKEFDRIWFCFNGDRASRTGISTREIIVINKT